MKALCSVYRTYSQQLTELHEMETEDSPFENVDLVINDPSNNIWSRAGKKDSDMTYSSGRILGT